MTLFDTLLLLIVLASLVVGWRKGLIRQTASIVGWVVGIVVCLFFGDTITELFLTLNPKAAEWPMPGITVKAVALSMTFLVVTLTLRIISFVMRKVVRVARLGYLDRVGGAALFAFKYTMLLSIALNLLFAFNPNADTFSTPHALNNRPCEFTLNLMPRVLGSNAMPADSLPIYRNIATADSVGNNDNPTL